MLEFKDVTKKYLRRAALDGVSFTLDAGLFFETLGGVFRKAEDMRKERM